LAVPHNFLVRNFLFPAKNAGETGMVCMSRGSGNVRAAANVVQLEIGEGAVPNEGIRLYC